MKVSERKIKPAQKEKKEELEVISFFVVLFIFGLKLSILIPPTFSIVLFVIILVGAFASKIKGVSAYYGLIILSFCTVLSGAFYGLVRIERPCKIETLREYDRATGTLKGRFVGGFKYLKNNSISFVVSNPEFEVASQTVRFNGLMKCVLPDAKTLPIAGQRYKMQGKIDCGFNRKFPAFTATNIEAISFRISPYPIAGMLHRKIQEGLYSLLPLRHADIMTGFMLGDTSKISQKDKEIFRKTGVSHLLAVSGQHIMIIVLLIASITFWLGIPPLSRSLVAIICLAMYGLTTAGEPSVWRAIVMYSVAVISMHIEASPGPIRPVAIAAFILLVIDPSVLNHSGFQLSFIAVLSILLLRPMFEFYLKKMHLPKTIARYIAISFAAGVGTMPMVAYIFGTISLSSLIVNPMIVWVFAFILPTGFIVSALAYVAPSIGLFVAPALSITLDGLLKILEYASSFKFMYVKIGEFPGIVCALAYLMILFILATWHKAVYSVEKKASENRIELVKGNNVSSLSASPLTRDKSISELWAKKTKSACNLTKKPRNPFKDKKMVESIDEILTNTPRRPLKNTSDVCIKFPYKKLSIENQTTFFQLSDLNKDVVQDQSRLIQAHILLMYILSSEFLNKLAILLSKTLSPDYYAVPFKLKNRQFSFVILADSILDSRILPLAADEESISIISKVNLYFSKTHDFFVQALDKVDDSLIDKHFQLREEILELCKAIALKTKSIRDLN